MQPTGPSGRGVKARCQGCAARDDLPRCNYDAVAVQMHVARKPAVPVIHHHPSSLAGLRPDGRNHAAARGDHNICRPRRKVQTFVDIQVLRAAPFAKRPGNLITRQKRAVPGSVGIHAVGAKVCQGVRQQVESRGQFPDGWASDTQRVANQRRYGLDGELRLPLPLRQRKHVRGSERGIGMKCAGQTIHDQNLHRAGEIGEEVARRVCHK